MRFSMLYSGEQILSFKSCLVFYVGDSLTFRLPWQLIKFSSLDLIHMVVRGLLKEHYCKAFVRISKVR